MLLLTCGYSSLLEFINPQFALAHHQGFTLQVDVRKGFLLEFKVHGEDFASPGINRHRRDRVA